VRTGTYVGTPVLYSSASVCCATYRTYGAYSAYVTAAYVMAVSALCSAVMQRSVILRCVILRCVILRCVILRLCDSAAGCVIAVRS
jgi:heme exporter protein D